jgi:hypothetical protein
VREILLVRTETKRCLNVWEKDHLISFLSVWVCECVGVWGGHKTKVTIVSHDVGRVLLFSTKQSIFFWKSTNNYETTKNWKSISSRRNRDAELSTHSVTPEKCNFAKCWFTQSSRHTVFSFSDKMCSIQYYC